jgi:hypothetical protein
MVRIAVAFLSFLLVLGVQAATLAGKWAGAASEQLAYGKVDHNLSIQLNLNGSAVTGSVTINTKTYAIQNGQFKDGKLSFSVDAGNTVITGALSYHADGMGERLTGRMTTDKGDAREVALKRTAVN